MFDNPTSLKRAIDHACGQLRWHINWFNSQIVNPPPKLSEAAERLKTALSNCDKKLNELNTLVQNKTTPHYNEQQQRILETTPCDEWISGHSRAELSTQLIQAILLSTPDKYNKSRFLKMLMDFCGESNALNLSNYLSTVWLFQELRTDIIEVISQTRDVCHKCYLLIEQLSPDDKTGFDSQNFFWKTMSFVKITANFYGIASKIFHIDTADQETFGLEKTKDADVAAIYTLPELNHYLQKFNIAPEVYQAKWFWDVVDLCYFPIYTARADHAKKSAEIIHQIEHDTKKFINSKEVVYLIRIQHILSRSIVPEQPTAGNPLLDDTILIPEPKNFDELSYFIAATLHNPDHTEQKKQFDIKVERLENQLKTTLDHDIQNCLKSYRLDKSHIEKKKQTAKSQFEQNRSQRTSLVLSRQDQIEARTARKQKKQFDEEIQIIEECEKRDLAKYNTISELLTQALQQLRTQFVVGHYTNKFIETTHQMIESIREHSTSKAKTLIYLHENSAWSTLAKLINSGELANARIEALNDDLTKEPIEVSKQPKIQQEILMELNSWLGQLEAALEALKTSEIKTIRSILEQLQNNYAQMETQAQSACVHSLWLLSDQLSEEGNNDLHKLLKILKQHFSRQITPPQIRPALLGEIQALHTQANEHNKYQIIVSARLEALTKTIYEDPFEKSKIPQSSLAQKIIEIADQEIKITPKQEPIVKNLDIMEWDSSTWDEYNQHASDYPTTKYDAKGNWKIDYYSRTDLSSESNLANNKPAPNLTKNLELLIKSDSANDKPILNSTENLEPLKNLEPFIQELVEKIDSMIENIPDLINKYPEIYWTMTTCGHQLSQASEAANKSQNIAEYLHRWTKVYLLFSFYYNTIKSIAQNPDDIDTNTIRTIRERSQYVARWSMEWKIPSRMGLQALDPQARDNLLLKALIKQAEYQSDSTYTPQLREYVIDRLSHNRIDVVEVLSKVVTLESCPIIHQSMTAIKTEKLLYQGEQNVNAHIWDKFERLYSKFDEFIDLTTQPNDPQMWQKRVDCIKGFELKDGFTTFITTLERKMVALRAQKVSKGLDHLERVHAFFIELYDLEHYIQTIIQLESQLTQHLHNNIQFAKNKPDKITLDHFRNHDDILELRFSEQLPELPEFLEISTKNDLDYLVSAQPESRLITSREMLDQTEKGEVIELSSDLMQTDDRHIIETILNQDPTIIFNNVGKTDEVIQIQIDFAISLAQLANRMPLTRERIQTVLYFAGPLKPRDYTRLKQKESPRVTIKQSFQENKANIKFPVSTITKIPEEKSRNELIEILVHQVKKVSFLIDNSHSEDTENAIDFAVTIFESVERRDRNKRASGQITICFTKLISGADYERFLIDKPEAIAITYADSSIKPIINSLGSMRIYLQQHEYNGYTSHQADASLLWLYKCQTLTDILCFILTGTIEPIYRTIDNISRVQHTGINIPSSREGAAIDFCHILNTGRSNQESYEPYIVDIEYDIGPLSQSNYNEVKAKKNPVKPSQILFLPDDEAKSISLLPHRFILDTRPTVDPKRDTALETSDSYTGGKTFKIEERFDPFTTKKIPPHHISIIKYPATGQETAKHTTEYLSYDLYISGHDSEEHGMTPDTLADLALGDIDNAYEEWHWKNAEHLNQTTVNRILELRKYSEAFKGTKHTLSEPEYKQKISRFRRLLREINTSDQQVGTNGEISYQQANLLYAIPWYRTLTENMQLTAHEQQEQHLSTLREQNMTLLVATHKLAGWGESCSIIEALTDLARIVEMANTDSIRAKTLIIHALIFGDITYTPIQIQDDQSYSSEFSVRLNKKLYTDESEPYKARIKECEQVITEQIESSGIDLNDPLSELAKLYEQKDEYAGILMSQIYLADNLAQYRKDAFEEHKNKGCKILLRLTSNKENAMAQMLYGICLLHGIEFTRFPSRGIQWINSAGGNHHTSNIQILGKDLLAYECGRFSYTFFSGQSVERLSNSQEIAKRIHDRRLLTDLNITTYSFFQRASHDEEARQNILQIGLLFTIPGVIDAIKEIHCETPKDRTHKRIEEQIVKGHFILGRNDELFYILLKYEPFKRAFLHIINDEKVPRYFSFKPSGSFNHSQKSSIK